MNESNSLTYYLEKCKQAMEEMDFVELVAIYVSLKLVTPKFEQSFKMRFPTIVLQVYLKKDLKHCPDIDAIIEEWKTVIPSWSDKLAKALDTGKLKSAADFLKASLENHASKFQQVNHPDMN
ncbi:hypothetical protein KC222_21175 [Cedecea davisae]|uniref:Uncharacterized protein n=1 Tax=Cedecea davisae TaxID=158484 RepID=A0ABS6DNV6_9ENTR|nr:hypothetical protein [Cedecea davisae]MBU4684511.1 hypothetical protein [Cedecea davisae]MBU4688643.1 hypothetical protein [Cedecea davisae]